MAREPQSAKRNFESGLREDQDSPGGLAARRRIDGQQQEPLHVSGEHRNNSSPRATRTGFLEGIGFEETSCVDTRRSAEEIAGCMLEAQRLNREVEAKKRKLQEAIEKESGNDARMGDDFLCRREGANTDIACNVRVETACRREL